MEHTKDSGSREDEPKPEEIKIRDRRRVKPGDPETSTSKEPADADHPIPDASEGDAANGGEKTASEDVDELELARQEAASHLDHLQRLKAEFENFRKRVNKEQSQFTERASASLVGKLLPVLDNFDLAVAAAENSPDFEKMRKGVEMVYGDLKEVLASEGLEPIKAKGEAFDPTRHEAALEVGDGQGEAVVGEVLRPGYLLNGQVLRPAMVKVTTDGGHEDEDGEQG